MLALRALLVHRWRMTALNIRLILSAGYLATGLALLAVPVDAQQQDPFSDAISAIIEQGANLALEPADFKAIKRQGNVFLIPSWLRRKAIISAPTLGTQGTITRVRSGKEVYGFRIESLAPGSLLPHFGFTSGDIVRRVNGTALQSESQALELATRLSTADEVRVELERKNPQPIKFTYRVIS